MRAALPRESKCSFGIDFARMQDHGQLRSGAPIETPFATVDFHLTLALAIVDLPPVRPRRNVTQEFATSRADRQVCARSVRKSDQERHSRLHPDWRSPKPSEQRV